MKISDLKDEDVRVGMRLWAIDRKVQGTIVKMLYPPLDRYQSAWIIWDGNHEITSTFFENQCDCEIVDEKEDRRKMWKVALLGEANGKV